MDTSAIGGVSGAESDESPEVFAAYTHSRPTRRQFPLVSCQQFYFTWGIPNGRQRYICKAEVYCKYTGSWVWGKRGSPVGKPFITSDVPRFACRAAIPGPCMVLTPAHFGTNWRSCRINAFTLYFRSECRYRKTTRPRIHKFRHDDQGSSPSYIKDHTAEGRNISIHRGQILLFQRYLEL